MVEITAEPISPEVIVNRVKGDKSGGVVTYVGLIRESSRDKKVASVEYRDSDGKAASRLEEIASETNQKWQLNAIAICHRTGRLKVGDINLVVAIASAHRKEGFAACQYVIDRFKEKLPTDKRETYLDGSIWTEGK
ncbi:MAG: molybdenum cofactor biosynthesis protein MoaE [Dehalococcoidales bacterium]|nr:molybdenum cofactor biosynthesis protein MoaE [Dehalococcoidales bacterium]